MQEKTVTNIFRGTYRSDGDDVKLVELAQQGNRQALEQLILKHQAWIYNIAFRMTGCVPDAEDATQEILIKMLTKLSTFGGRSNFRTWLYRIVTNHVLNMKKSRREQVFCSFEQHYFLLQRAPEQDLTENYEWEAKSELLVEETKIQCLLGMLLCLDREQRLVFILGAVFGASSAIGGEILGITPESFRKNLSRTRKHLQNYMNDNCSLVNKEASCRCARKTRAAVAAGYVDPNKLLYTQEHLQKIRYLAVQYSGKVDQALNTQPEVLFREHPFLNSANYLQNLRNIICEYELLN